MTVIQRCPNCNEPIAKNAANQPGGILFCGPVIAFDNYGEVVCKLCKHHTRIEATFALLPHAHPVLLPDRRHRT